MLEKNSWSQYDGLGALVISPTRELALQIFSVLKKIGKFHSFSAGLLIGGKNVKQEKERISRMNILIATPGRLLQHMDTTVDFNCDNLQMLVLDEADRILDSGFEKTLNAIIENLPKLRQTLLFSATQTKSVRDLARLSLKDPEYVAVHEKAETATPTTLVQKYLVCELPQKLDILFSFIKTHLKTKLIIFLSSCKQVKFVHDTFCKMQPGIQLMCLHGKQKQTKRMSIFEEFCRKKAVCMFATDIAARGLDFPAVDWVVQVDCPEDADTYIHRVGRTARYESKGNALMFLLPSEENGMLELLEKKKIPIEKIKVNPSKLTFSIPKQLQAFCFQDPEIKYLGQKAFVSYVRSVYLQKHKSIFKLDELPLAEYASSLGLPSQPQIKLLKNRKKNQTSLPKEETDKSEEKKEAKKATTKIDRMFQRKNMDVLSAHYQSVSKAHSEEESDADDFMKIKRRDHEVEDSVLTSSAPVVKEASKQKLKKLKEKELKNRGLGQKMVFDEDGNAKAAYSLETFDEFKEKLTNELGSASGETGDIIKQAGQVHAEMKRREMQDVDVLDKQMQKERIKEQKKLRKLREKEKRREESGEVGVSLAAPMEADSSASEEAFSEEEEAYASYEDAMSEESETEQVPAKRRKVQETEDLEAIALGLLS